MSSAAPVESLPSSADRGDHTHRGLLAAVAGVTGLVLVLTAGGQIYDTNFYLLWEATAILAGDHPYRDFFEWGAPLAAYASAGAQILVGYRLIGEFLLQWSFIVAGVVIAFHLGLRLSGSRAASLVMLAIALVILAYTPTYHYSKLFFFPLMIWLAWRYVEHPSPSRSAALACTTSIAFLFRHDYGVCLGFGSVLALALARAAVPASRRARSIVSDGAAYAVVTAVVLAPLAIVVQLNEGLPQYIQMRAARYPPPEGLVWASLLDLSPVRALLSWPLPSQAAASVAGVLWLQQMTLLLPLLLLTSAGLDVWRSRRRGGTVSPDAWRMIFAGTFLAAVDTALVREPAYLVIVTPVTAALSARVMLTKAGDTRLIRVVRTACAVGVLLLTAVAALIWTRDAHLLQPFELVASVPGAFKQLLASPPVLASAPLDGNPALSLRYLHDCTAEGDRLLVTGSTPFQVNYYAERPFAGGHVFWHHHWRSDAPHEQQSLALLQRQSVPFVISTTGPILKDFESYPNIREYLVKNYVELEGSHGRLLIDTRRAPRSRYGPGGFPCFR